MWNWDRHVVVVQLRSTPGKSEARLPGALYLLLIKEKKKQGELSANTIKK